MWLARGHGTAARRRKPPGFAAPVINARPLYFFGGGGARRPGGGRAGYGALRALLVGLVFAPDLRLEARDLEALVHQVARRGVGPVRGRGRRQAERGGGSVKPLRAGPAENERHHPGIRGSRTTGNPARGGAVGDGAGEVPAKLNCLLSPTRQADAEMLRCAQHDIVWISSSLRTA